MRPLPLAMPDVARRWVVGVPPDPYLRLDTDDYSLDPAFVGRRIEVRVDHRARSRPRPPPPPPDRTVEVQPLARYDALIA
jgi:hypothetical protein